MLTRQQAVEQIERMRKAITDWETGDAPTAMWKGKPFKQFTAPVVEVMGEVCGLFLTEDIERDARELAMAVDIFRDELNRFFDAQKVAEDAVRPSGSDEMWSALTEVARLLRPRPRKLPGSIRQLQRDGCNAITIAKKFGWYTPDGKPDLQRVSEEDTEPGTHYDPATYVHPSEKAEFDRIEKRWIERCRRLADLTQQTKTEGPRAPRKPDPRSIEELFRNNPGIRPEQVAKMKCCAVEEIHSQLEEQGLFYSTSTGLRSGDPERRAAWLNRDLRPETHPESDDVLGQFKVHDECGTDLEARILAMSEDGTKPRNIAKALSRRLGTTVTYQQVTAVLAKLQPAAG